VAPNNTLERTSLRAATQRALSLMDKSIAMSEEDVQVLIHRHRLAEVIATAGRQLAARSTTVEVLINRVASLWQDADASGVMSRLAELELPLSRRTTSQRQSHVSLLRPIPFRVESGRG